MNEKDVINGNRTVEVLGWVGVTMLPICLLLGLLSAIVDCIWPEGGRK